MGVTMAAVAAGCTEDERVVSKPVGLSIEPHNGSAQVRPDTPILVRAAGGTLQNVTVRARGADVAGLTSGDRSQWRSRWTLAPDTRYDVVATALGKDGRTRTVSSAFTTQKVKRAVTVSMEAPNQGETVGVGMPIILRFDREVTDRAAVERALEVRSSKRVEGAWRWLEDGSLVFRTRRHWPTHTDVRVIAHLNGVRALRDGYATQDLDVKFRIGEEHATVADAKTHRMVVYRNGKQIRDFPVSMGRGGVHKYITTSGNHLTMDKGNPVIMDSSTLGCGPGCPGYYRMAVYWSVRISNSGEYAHAAPWSVGSQGNSNVTHGCVNMHPDAAQWFYKFSYRGDPFKVVGTSRELEPGNGWGYWQMDWEKWAEGSALKQTLWVGPEGSVPVQAKRLQAPRPTTSPSA
ncbi:Lipoprotein-anchoring transpeptidase ErfK/SrfK [Thermomonospora echinospora]|uniref:Lipoprotein-anchoring transpeptidase ErfK/SrfK n=1 Tax=Thermomonospora echinospora TaxID=1992 RepID=A0A1H5S4H9_9ACTN|nr:Ig-like domain-containing protein [Thermomonospora echinospora]SEF45526.1 Lipoprotein-anchoring transpeptidase ErfK/SrfK [Thermomonospora echinospora]